MEKHLKIRINSIKPNRPTSFDVFVKIGERFIHYLKAGDGLDANKIKKLHESGQEVFYVRDADRLEFKKYIHNQLNATDLNVSEKALILRESSYALVEELFENPNINQALDESKEVVSNFVTFIEAEPEAMANLIGLSSHDFYTYNHSLDVCIYSLALGGSVGYSSETDLQELGRGSLFHDIGKRHVATEIICKNGPLDEVEWAQMKNHPLYGLQILNDYPDSSDNLKACVFEHHENVVGNGYPQQLLGDEIHPMAKIVAITDCYDALTTKRSYNNPMSPFDAVTMMRDKLLGKFDPELLKVLYDVMSSVKRT